MTTENDTKATDYRGETLDELRLRRAMVAVRLDMQKEVLQRKAQEAMGEVSEAGGLTGILTGSVTSRFPAVGIVLTGLKVARLAFKFVRLFKRK